MKTTEKLALLVGLAVLATILTHTSHSAVREMLFGSDQITEGQVRILGTVRLWFTLLVNLACGIWLFVVTVKTEYSTWVWAIFGVCTGLIGVAVFYMAATYERLRLLEMDRGK